MSRTRQPRLAPARESVVHAARGRGRPLDPLCGGALERGDSVIGEGSDALFTCVTCIAMAHVGSVARAANPSRPVRKRKARALRKGIIQAGVEVDAPPPRLNRLEHEAMDGEVEDGAPILICPSCYNIYGDVPTVKEAVCEDCERTLRRYACIANPEAAR